MVCIYCGSDVGTANSRPQKKNNSTWRRKKCKGCGATFTSVEDIDLSLALRFSSSEGLQPFSQSKLSKDIENCLSHRSEALKEAQSITRTVISLLIPVKSGVIDRAEVVAACEQVLRRFDKAAATSYRAHHK